MPTSSFEVTRISVLAAVCIALNVGLNKAAVVLGLPVFMDTVGTVLSAALIPPAAPTALAGSQILQIDAADQIDGSGVADMRVALAGMLDSAAWQPFTPTLPVFAAPRSMLVVEVRDRAGNISAATSATVGASTRVYLTILRR